jgi:hypothetical protein
VARQPIGNFKTRVGTIFVLTGLGSKLAGYFFEGEVRLLGAACLLLSQLHYLLDKVAFKLRQEQTQTI